MKGSPVPGITCWALCVAVPKLPLHGPVSAHSCTCGSHLGSDTQRGRGDLKSRATEGRAQGPILDRRNQRRSEGASELLNAGSTFSGTTGVPRDQGAASR